MAHTISLIQGDLRVLLLESSLPSNANPVGSSQEPKRRRQR